MKLSCDVLGDLFLIACQHHGLADPGFLESPDRFFGSRLDLVADMDMAFIGNVDGDMDDRSAVMTVFRMDLMVVHQLFISDQDILVVDPGFDAFSGDFPDGLDP